MRPQEKVAVITAMKKALDDALKQARAEADDALMEAYEVCKGRWHGDSRDGGIVQ